MYHYVRPSNKKNGNLRYLDKDHFQVQLDFFEKNYGFLSQEEFMYNFKNKIITKKVLLTFDDGLKDHYNYVFPILKERNISELNSKNEVFQLLLNCSKMPFDTLLQKVKTGHLTQNEIKYIVDNFTNRLNKKWSL